MGQGQRVLIHRPEDFVLWGVRATYLGRLREALLARHAAGRTEVRLDPDLIHVDNVRQMLSLRFEMFSNLVALSWMDVPGSGWRLVFWCAPNALTPTSEALVNAIEILPSIDPRFSAESLGQVVEAVYLAAALEGLMMDAGLVSPRQRENRSVQ